MLPLLLPCLLAHLAAARRHPYPAGVCTASNSTACFAACDSATCSGDDGRAACGLLTYPLVTRGKRETKCLPDYRATCGDRNVNQAGCNRCALWRLMQDDGQCPDAGSANAAGGVNCERRGWYAVMAAQEKEKGDVGGLCASKDHWLVLPTHPCTGIESDDPDCTGPPAERLWWAAAVATAADKGFKINSTRRWGALLNSPPWRGQHQQHIHVAYLNADDPKGKVIPLYLNRTQFSTDARRPTVLTGDDGTEMATVFVEGGLVQEDGGGKIAPFDVGAEVAAKAKANVPYGLFVEPFAQAGKRGGRAEAGFLISATYGWNDKTGMVSGGTDDCSPACAPL